MKIRSINIGLPRQVVSDGQAVMTGIYKIPVHRSIKINKLNLEGDGQADLSVHGGPNKAVYGYPSEHYEYWRRELPGMELPWGVFGENLTLQGLTEDTAHIGDRFRAGTAVLMITQPRLPCYKLGIRFGLDEMPDRFLSSRRTGFYFAVIEEGELGAGDSLERVHQDINVISVTEILRLLYDHEPPGPEFFKRALNIAALPPNWRKRLEKRLTQCS